MIKSNTKIKLFLTSALLISLAVVSIVGAIPASAVPVTATQTGTASFSDGALNDGGIYFWDMIETGPVSLYITSTSTADYVLQSYGEAHAMINTKTNDGGFHRNMTWTYKVNSVVMGTFEGQVNVKTTTFKYSPTGIPLPKFSTNIYHTILQGSGIFEGQTLKLDGIRPTLNPSLPINTPLPGNPVTWTGILLTH